MTSDTLDPDEARDRLYQLMRMDTPFEQKAGRALELGKAYLGVDHAHLTRVDQQTDYWEAISSTDPEDGRYPTGLVADLQTTYCRRTIQEDASVALHDAPAQGWGDDPAFETHGLRCYHGTPIRIDEETYGTVCFVSEAPREPFTDGDTMFAELTARMLEHELERSHHDAELTRRSNLINVLNRVLRHNLRNSMTVIRGQAQLIADTFDAPGSNVIVDQADQLIDLSEKARKLESVLVNEGYRQETDLQTLVTEVVRDVAGTYPEASITVDAPESVTLPVRPGLRMALHELLENAAEHTGTEPTITVTVETRPNAVEIDISDEGPGLSDIEREVLTDGVETPLAHGSGLGLWLAYWIVTSHDGTIDATVSGDGTRMSIRLPRDVSATVPPHHEQRERTIHRVQDTFRSVFDEAFDAMLTVNDDGYIIDANRSAAELLRMSARELRGRPLAEFIGDDVETIWNPSDDSGRERGTAPVVRADGTERIVEYATTANFVPEHNLAIMRDISDRVERERELEVAETIFQNTQDAIFLVDVTDTQEFRIQRVNDAYEELTGLSNDDIRGSTPREAVGAEMGADIEARYHDCVARRETIEYPERIPVDGEDRYWQTKLTPIIEDGSVSKLVGAMRDVTDRIRREQRLERYETVLETVEDAAWVLDAEKRLTFVNRAALETLSVPREQVAGAPLSAFQEMFANTSTFEAYETLVEELLAGTRAEGELDATLDLSGEERVVNIRVVPVSGDDGAAGVVGIARDITERTEREQELRMKSRAIERAPIGITIADATRPDNPLVYSNQAFQQLTGYPAEEIRGRNCRFLQGERTDPDTVATIRDAIDAERTVSAELRNYRSDGTEFWNHLTVAPVTNEVDDVTHYVGFQQETTSQQGEHDLPRNERVMEAVLSNAPVALWTTDEEGCITRARGAALAHLEVEPEEMVGGSVFDVFDAYPAVCDHTVQALDGESVTAAITDGDVEFDVHCEPLGDGELVGSVGFITLTDRDHPHAG